MLVSDTCGLHSNLEQWTELLAPSPDVFAGAHNIVPSSQPSSPYRMTNIGLHVTAQIENMGREWMLLNCYDQEDPTKAILLNLRCEYIDGQDVSSNDVNATCSLS